MNATNGFTGFTATPPLPDAIACDPDHAFGVGNRPSTPIRAVVGNMYGEVAAFLKYKQFRDTK
jgi:hypothetical protein